MHCDRIIPGDVRSQLLSARVESGVEICEMNIQLSSCVECRSHSSHSSVVTIMVCDKPPRSTQPGHPFVGRHNEYQPKDGDALSRGVKAGMSRVWVAGKTV